MRAGHFLPLVVGVGFLSGSILAARSAQAGTVMENINYNAQDQSIWNTGDAVQIDFNQFFAIIDEDFDVSVGGFVLGTGAEVGVRGGIRTGFDVGFEFDSGSVDVDYPVKTTVMFPDKSGLAAGDISRIDSMYEVNNASLEANFPSVEGFIDFVFQFNTEVFGEACFADICTSGSVDLINADTAVELASINRDNSGEINVAGLPFQFGEDIPLFQQAGGALGELQVFLPFSTTEPDATADLDFAKVPTDDPSLHTPEVQDDFINLSADLDAIAVTIAQSAGIPIPPLEGSFDLVIASVDYNLLDVELGLGFDVTQQFWFEPNLMVQYDFDIPVQLVDPNTGLPVGGPVMMTGPMLPGTPIDLITPNKVTVTPTYWLEPTLQNLTGLEIAVIGQLLLLEFGFDVFGLDALSIGPLLNLEGEIVSFPTIPIVDLTFPLGEPIHFEGKSFMIMASPEPGTLILLGSGLVVAALARRRMARKSRA